MSTTQFFDKYIRELQDAVSHYAPKAWHILVQVKQAEAIVYLGEAFVCFVVFGGLTLIAHRMSQGVTFEFPEEPPPLVFCARFFFGLASITALCFLLMSPWAWITAVNPQLGALHQILSAGEARLNPPR